MRWLLLTGVVLATAACPGTETADRPDDPAARRARDSAVGASNLPGAQGVRGALDVADTAAAREARRDSIRRGQ